MKIIKLRSGVLIVSSLLLIACGGGSATSNTETETVTDIQERRNNTPAPPRNNPPVIPVNNAPPTAPTNNNPSAPTNNTPTPPATVILTAENSTTVLDGTRILTTALVSLGQSIYNDTNLSVPAGQSCASCHTPTLATGFDDPESNQPTSLGANGSSFGTRNSPTASYAAHIPPRQTILRPGRGGLGQVAFGGQFLDGRADTLEEQAKAPFLNPDEMANSSSLELIEKIKLASYANDFEETFGTDVLNDVDKSFDYIADAIAAFERTDLFSPFSSKFDQVVRNNTTFTASEARGQRLFNGRAQCDTCHQSPNGFREVFSDFEYRNIGVPRNLTLLNNLGNQGFRDNGLGGVTNNPADDGKFRVANLRNIAITAPYMHNGVFNTLTEVVQFYNTRDTTFTLPPEVNRNVDQRGSIGELRLNNRDVQDLVSFLQTLTDQ